MPAIAVAMIASSAMSAYAAHSQASAAKSGAAMQNSAAQRALDLNQQIWGQQQQMQQPYLRMGRDSANLLGSLMMNPMGPGGVMRPGLPSPSPGQPPMGQYPGGMLAPWQQALPNTFR